ncbi:MAG TPA: 2-dehydropantoate 2-reductase [Gemmatimonadaceae bacterium]|nr:2-dehydropantoate 2-reductase [Gemmatimonadaceae bacterium]
MKIAVVGAGAIGGYVGGWLAAAGEDVTFIARGANLDAIRRDGMRVVGEDGSVVTTHPTAFEKMRDAGPQDFIILAVKAHQVAGVAADLAALCNANTAIVTMQNGIPWWYFHKHGGEYEGTAVRSADPDGAIARHIDAHRVIGSVVFPAATLEAPGVVRVVEGKRFTLGEPDGSISERVQTISSAFTRAGFKAPVISDIRGEIWLKLWGNLSFNPISALTHATLAGLLRFPLTRELSIEVMREAELVANKLGVSFRVGIDKRIAGAEKVGEHKTSMLQDVEAGRPLEIEALVGAVVELGRLTNTPTPHIDSLYALVTLLARELADGGKLSIARSPAPALPAKPALAPST